MIEGHDILDLEQRLMDAVTDLGRRSDAVALARQIKEFNGEQRKNLLARFAAPLLADNSAAAADTLARANELYQQEIAALAEQYARAEKHIAAYDAAYARFDAARSLLAMARQQLPAAMKGAEQ